MNSSAVTRFIARVREAFAEDDHDTPNRQREASHVELLQRQFEAIAAGDFAAFQALLHDDIEAEILGPAAIPIVGRWRGKQVVAEAVRKNFSHFEDQQPEIQSVVAQGDLVVLIARERGRFRATGKSYDLHFMQIYTFRDSKVVRFRSLCDTAALLEAVNPGPA